MISIHYNCICIYFHQPEDGHMSGRNLSVITV